MYSTIDSIIMKLKLCECAVWIWDIQKDSQAARSTRQAYLSLHRTDWRWRPTPGRTWCCQSNRWTLGRDPERRGEGRRREGNSVSASHRLCCVEKYCAYLNSRKQTIRLSTMCWWAQTFIGQLVLFWGEVLKKQHVLICSFLRNKS